MIRQALRKGTLDGKFTPVHCGSSKKYHGVQLLLDARRGLPAVAGGPAAGRRASCPRPRRSVAAQARPEASRSSALAFKTVSEKRRRPGVHAHLLRRAASRATTIMNTGRSSKTRARRPHLSADGRPPRPLGSGRPGRDRRRRRPEADVHGPHAVRRRTSRSRWRRSASPSRSSRQAIIPAKNVGRDEAGRRAGQDGPRRPDAEDQDRRGDQAAHPQRHGRACTWKCRSRSCSATTGVQGDRRQADGRLPPDARQAGRVRDALHQADGRPRQVRRHRHASTSR